MEQVKIQIQNNAGKLTMSDKTHSFSFAWFRNLLMRPQEALIQGRICRNLVSLFSNPHVVIYIFELQVNRRILNFKHFWSVLKDPRILLEILCHLEFYTTDADNCGIFLVAGKEQLR